ncbi:MAG: site-2 protease family protein [Acidobacteria bacterium]|nr:site-2 protease family protein [Acidobacteriota bacterium]
MKWSWKIGTLAGIELRMHVTFLLLLAWVGATHWMAGRSFDAVWSGVAFILALFGCVLLHELGHSLAARKYGIPTRDITLLPIGGVARLERMPEKPGQELWVALAGPAVNVAISAALFLWLSITQKWVPLGQMQVASGPFLERLLIANVWLVLFNLIPAFPMDGGRVLRALLASRMEYVRATQIAAGVGQGLALLFGLIGLFGNPMLLFIALFVWIGASSEASATQMKAALAGTPIQAAMLTDFRQLSSGDTRADAVRLGREGSQQDFPVVERGRVVGILTRSDLLLALAEHGQDHPVTSAMRRELLTTDYTEMLEIAFQRLQECGCHTMPVIHEGRLAGLLTMDNLGEYLLIQAAINKGSGGSGGAAVLQSREAGWS